MYMYMYKRKPCKTSVLILNCRYVSYHTVCTYPLISVFVYTIRNHIESSLEDEAAYQNGYSERRGSFEQDIVRSTC